jgi:hypothetical protein
MLRKSASAVAMISIALFVPLSQEARAATDVVTTLVMPAGTDPSKLTFTQPGLLYTRTDGSIPGDQLGSAINGNLLLTAADNGAGGLELHGNVVAPIANTTVPVVEVDLFTTYAGNMVMNTAIGGQFTSFTPWGVQALGTVPTGFTQGFRFFKQPGSADINKGGFYGFLSSALNSNPNPADFRNADFGMQGFTKPQSPGTPEPGTLALLVGMGLSVCVFARKRHRK